MVPQLSLLVTLSLSVLVAVASAGYTTQPTSYSTQPTTYNFQPTGYSTQPTGYNFQPIQPISYMQPMSWPTSYSTQPTSYAPTSTTPTTYGTNNETVSPPKTNETEGLILPVLYLHGVDDCNTTLEVYFALGDNVCTLYLFNDSATNGYFKYDCYTETIEFFSDENCTTLTATHNKGSTCQQYQTGGRFIQAECVSVQPEEVLTLLGYKTLDECTANKLASPTNKFLYVEGQCQPGTSFDGAAYARYDEDGVSIYPISGTTNPTFGCSVIDDTTLYLPFDELENTCFQIVESTTGDVSYAQYCRYYSAELNGCYEPAPTLTIVVVPQPVSPTPSPTPSPSSNSVYSYYGYSAPVTVPTGYSSVAPTGYSSYQAPSSSYSGYSMPSIPSYNFQTPSMPQIPSVPQMNYQPISMPSIPTYSYQAPSIPESYYAPQQQSSYYAPQQQSSYYAPQQQTSYYVPQSSGNGYGSY